MSTNTRYDDDEFSHMRHHFSCGKLCCKLSPVRHFDVDYIFTYSGRWEPTFSITNIWRYAIPMISNALNITPSGWSLEEIWRMGCEHAATESACRGGMQCELCPRCTSAMQSHNCRPRTESQVGWFTRSVTFGCHWIRHPSSWKLRDNLIHGYEHPASSCQWELCSCWTCAVINSKKQ